MITINKRTIQSDFTFVEDNISGKGRLTFSMDGDLIGIKGTIHSQNRYFGTFYSNDGSIENLRVRIFGSKADDLPRLIQIIKTEVEEVILASKE